jgi:sugar lactone lactonase YvrE
LEYRGYECNMFVEQKVRAGQLENVRAEPKCSSPRTTRHATEDFSDSIGGMAEPWAGVLLLSVLAHPSLVLGSAPAATVDFQWKYLDFTWRNESEHQAYLASRRYEGRFTRATHRVGPRHRARTRPGLSPVGVRAWKSPRDGGLRFFLTVPRFTTPPSPAVLVTFAASAPFDPASGGPLLTPFPSWEMNDPGISGSIQSALGLAVDAQDRLWLVDNGRVADRDAVRPQLLIFALADSTLARRFTFPESVAPLASSFLNDVVVDATRGKAYISDSSDPTLGVAAGIIVYDFNSNAARRVLSSIPAVQPQPGVTVTINGQVQTSKAGADGIALSPDGATLFFTALTSHSIYSLPTAVVNNASAAATAAVQLAVNKSFTSDGVIFDAQGRLLMGSLDDSAVFVSTLGVNGALSAPSLLFGNSSAMQWPDTLAFDHRGNLIVVRWAGAAIASHLTETSCA